MSISRIFSTLHHVLARHRVPLLVVTALAMAAAGFLFSGTDLREDIGAMLPDDRSDAARDFALLDRAPFSRKVVVTLTAPEATPAGTLTDAADRFAGALAAPVFTRVTTGPNDETAALPAALLDILPELASPADLAALDAKLSPAAVRALLEEDYARLLSPEGWVVKDLLRRDPLDFLSTALGKARQLSLVPGMRVVRGHFLSADGRSALVLSETPVPPTDNRGAREVRAGLAAAAAVLPPDVRASAVSGHLYTLANAETIVGDLALILSLSSLAILAIYVGFLRSWWALFVFLVPLSVLVLASGWVAAVSPAVFAVTVGFGGVLLGMADEYAMHVWFALRKDPGDPARVLGEVARPVLYGGLATSAAFGVMLTSTLPGQRQLASFSMAGIAASLLLSLLVLPQVLPTRAWKRSSNPPALPDPPRPPRRLVIAAWTLGMAACAWFAVKVRFDGDVGRMNMVPPELRAAEQRVRETWGDPRGRAVIFAEGETLDEALARNAAVYDLLAAKLPPDRVVSLAPVLPSSSVREENLRRWEEFWRGGRKERLAAALAAEGERLGFSRGAFDPFLISLGPVSPDGGPDRLRRAGLGDLLDSLVLHEGGVWRVLTLVPDTPEAASLFPAAGGSIPGVRFVSQSRFRDLVSRAIGVEFRRYLVLTSLIILAIVVLAFRDWRKASLSLVPVLSGVLFMFGVMGATGLAFNLFNVVACVLIIGLCVDYGIFMVSHVTGGTDHAAARAVLVSGLTTIAGFGVLAFARHPAMRSIGITVLLGFGAAVPAALLVIPALQGEKHE